MQITTTLDNVLASRGHVRVLRALDALPEGLGVSVRDLARRAGIGHPRAAEVLASLTEAGLTTVQRAGRADLYQLNREHLLYPTLHRLFVDEASVTDALAQFLRKGLSKRVDGVREAYIFGSVARGDSRPGSDIDLAVVAPGAETERVKQQLEAIAAEVRRRFGSTLSIHASTQPLARRVRGRDGRDLWRRIADEGVRILPHGVASGE